MANIMKGLGGFAEGLVSGYQKFNAMKEAKELHDAQMTKIRDEQAMNAEIKKLSDTTVKPVDSYVVSNEDGTSTAYTDPAMAHDAAALNPGAQVTKKILVAGKQFDTADDAKAAVEQANSPIAKMRMAADVAMKYNRPDIAGEYQKAYKVRVDQNRQDAGQTILDAAQAGDTDALMKAYNDRLPNGRKATLVPGDNGSVALQITSNGKPVGAPQVFANTDALFQNAYKTVGTTPDNAFETWQHSQQLGMQQQGLNLQARGVAVQEATGAANVAQTNAETASIPTKLAIAKQQAAASTMGAQASMTSAGASVTNARTQQMVATMPKVNSGVDDQDNVTFNTTQPVFDPETKQWGLNVTKPQAVPGMNPTMTAKTFAPPKPDMFGLGAPQQVPTAADIAAALGALPKKAPTK